MFNGTADAEALAALNAAFAERWQALWTAAHEAATSIQGDTAPLPQLPTIVAAAPGDRRFAAAEWEALPYFSLLKQSYLLAGDYVRQLVALSPLPAHERHRVEFLVRQAIDAMAPSNFAATNPQAISRALATDGGSLAQGFANLVSDAAKGRISMTDERAFGVGTNLATTPGDVVYRNELIELVQYAPATRDVHARPLVVIPPCINKYYILDLSPANSFARHCVEAGHTVFIISWRNIPSALGRLTWDDYLEDGALAAIRAAREIAGGERANVLGFCVGGTLAACALAVLAARGRADVQSLTLLATLTDFAEPGDIGVYISRESLALREPSLAAGERVRGSEIAGAFATLRANELVWHYVVNNYLLGATPAPFDLLYWNSDPSNLPGPMYAYYLRNLYLDNRLREPDALTMAGERVDLGRVRVPAYVLATRDDHIVPWRSAYATVALLGQRPTFVLGTSGHIAGVISPPGRSRRDYWIDGDAAADAESWLATAKRVHGSWWPHWSAWLAPHAGPRIAAPARAGSDRYAPLERAPGRYVREIPD